MKSVAFLWWENEVNWEDTSQPFEKDWKSKDYAKYTELGKEEDLEIYVGEYRWYSEGMLEKAWYWNGKEWEKKQDVEINGVYDLFRHDKEKLKIKQKMKEEVGIINDPELTDICQDKLQTYELFKQHIPESRKYDDENLEEMLSKYSKVVLKPRYGSSGEGIKIIGSKEELNDFSPKEDYLIQKFMETNGADWLGIEGPHDVRIFVINGEIVGSHVRTPGEDSLLSNNALGGDQEYVDLEKIPEKAKNIVKEVGEKLNKFEPSIYTVDFMFGKDDEPKIVELNSQPGIFYHQDVKDKEHELPMMKKVVKSIKKV